MKNNWADFKAVKQAVSMEKVLNRYKIELRRVNQTSLRGKCPLPTHSSEESKQSFSVHLAKSIWACQSASCVNSRSGRRGGNVLDFVAAMERCSLREAALRLQEWFMVPTPADAKPSAAQAPPADKPEEKPAAEETKEQPEGENKPLAFALKGVDFNHPYLTKRGLKPETATAFGVGFFQGKGSMSGRVVIPIHNTEGQLVAYAGRSIDGSEPKYRVPAGFKKSLVFFNLHRALQSRGKRAVVVEGFFDCMKVYQAGVSCPVALMGTSLSERQELLLVEHFDQVIVMLDGDEAGRQSAAEISSRLVRRLFVRVADLPEGKQPDQLSSQEIREILGFTPETM